MLLVLVTLLLLLLLLILFLLFLLCLFFQLLAGQLQVVLGVDILRRQFKGFLVGLDRLDILLGTEEGIARVVVGVRLKLRLFGVERRLITLQCLFIPGLLVQYRTDIIIKYRLFRTFDLRFLVKLQRRLEIILPISLVAIGSQLLVVGIHCR